MMTVSQYTRMKRGISLMELLVTISVLGLALGIGLPQIIRLRERAQLNAAAQQVLGDMQRAQAEALRRNKTVKFFKTAAGSYKLDFVGDRNLPIAATLTFSVDTIRFASFGPPSSGAANVSIQYGTRTKTVALSSNGHLKVQ